MSLPSDACTKCGYHLSPALQRKKSTTGFHGEKKHVTILFSDLTGYTALMQRLDPEEVKEIMAKIFVEITKAVNNYGGFIEKYVGDAIMALFGTDKSHEDDPIRAIKAAQEIHKRMESLNLYFENATGGSLKMHTGINSGVVVTGEMKHEQGVHGALGDAINMAYKFMSIAHPGEIVVGPDTYHRAKNSFLFEKNEGTDIKGGREKVETYKVLSNRTEPDKMQRLSGMRADLIGREREISILRKGLNDLKTGHGSIISVIGNAGTGKSRLIEEFKGLIGMDEIQWREGRAYEYSHDIPYSPLIDLLRRTMLIHEDYTPEQIKSKLESRYRFLLADRRDLMPYLASLFSLSYDSLEEISPEMWKAKLREAIQTIMANISSKIPTVICFEDLHWADPSSIKLLRTILSDFNHPILLVCTYRPPFALFEGPPGESDIPHNEIILKDLSSHESYMMIESFLGSADPPEELRLFIETKAEGNPFYIEELLRSLVEMKALTKEDGRWILKRHPGTISMPTTVQGVILARVDRMDGNQKQVLREAAVIGREFPFQILKGITSAKETIYSTVAYLERMDLIRRIESAPQLTYGFKHVLTQEAVYEGLLKKDLRAIHETIGLAMEQLFQERLPEYYEMLSFHFSRGSSTHKAVFYLRKSGDKNVRRYSLPEARNFYAEAFNLLLEKTGKTREDELLLVDTLFDWTVTHYHRAAYFEMYELLSRYQSLVLSLNDKARTGMFFIRIGSALSRMERNSEAYRYLNKALEIGEEIGDSRIIAHACAWMITTCADLGLVDEALMRINMIRKTDLYASDEQLFRLTTASLGYVHYFMGNSGTVLEAGNLLVEYGKRNGDTGSLCLGHTCIGMSKFIRGDYPSAIDSLKESTKVSLEPMYVYATKIMMGITYVTCGQFAEAEDILDDILEFSDHHGYSFVSTMALGLSGIVMIAKGNIPEGIDTVNNAIRFCSNNNSKWRYASLNMMLGRFYLQLAREGLGRATPFHLKNFFFLIRIFPFAGKKAEHHLTIAADTAREIGAKGILGQTSLELCCLYKLRGKIDRARSCIQEAVSLFEECEAENFLGQAGKLMASLS